MMASKDDNKCKYADGVEKEAPPKKQKMIGDYNGDDDNCDDSSSSTDDYSSNSEEVSSEKEEMNLLTGCEDELLIRRGCYGDVDTSDSEKNDSIRNGGETSNNGDTSDDEEEQFSDEGSAFD
jgi:hypothetical protein